MCSIQVNSQKIVGKIKPMHGVGQPPVIGTDFSRIDYLAEAGVPFSRLHDVGGPYGGSRYVDIQNVFRNFDADPSDPDAYDFAFTDLLVTSLVERGVEPFFRLGVTIENACAVRAYYIYPPKDNFKWARICEGIIRHYTEGWADGFHYSIRYWEIWNEPDNYEDPMENCMWRGTKEQYFELYRVASKYLKEKFPHLKIGGYASCGFYAIAEMEQTEDAHCSPRNAYFIEFFDAFLTYIKKHDCPLDFFSWHSYSSAEMNVKFAAYARKRLDEAGFIDTEHTLNEWNWKPRTIGTMEHASATAGMLLALQDTSLDSAMFYDARCGIGIYSGMFCPVDYNPYPAYYAFKAFGELYRCRQQLEVQCKIPEVYAVAAANSEKGCLVVANTGETEIPLQIIWQGKETVIGCRILTEGKIWQEIELPEVLPGYSVLCVYFEKSTYGKI